jgi:hypothetical protein
MVREVLEQLYAHIGGSSEAEKDRKIRDAFSEIEKSYKRLREAAPSHSYTDPAVRFAYIYRYVTSTAVTVGQLLGHPVFRALTSKQTIQVTCIGGGPGSDYIGLSRWLNACQPPRPAVKAFITDKHPVWANDWGIISDHLSEDFKVFCNHLPLDVTVPDQWQQYYNILTSDLFSFVYFFSEIYTAREAARQFLADVCRTAHPGALMLYLDNYPREFFEWFEEIATANGVALIHEGKGELTVPSDEDKKDLGRFLDKFSPPRLKLVARWCILQKRGQT